jgi:CRISPR-associated protein Cas6
MSAAADTVVDVAFALEGTTLPADHAESLACAVERWLPWLADEPGAGIHPLRTAATSHGMLVIARRAKLVLRLPAGRARESRELCGRTLAIGESQVSIGAASERPLSPASTLYASRVMTDAPDEQAFHGAVVRWLADAGVRCEFIAGRSRRLIAGGREVTGFALALHGLAPADSLHVQASGMGGQRRLGCGIFVPHKAIAIAHADG